MKIVLIILGSIFAGIGILGIFIPGLPTTPFLLLSAGLYARSSEKLYQKLLSSRLIGKYIKLFRKNKGMSLFVKLTSLALMWGMITLSIFLINKLLFTIILLAIGFTGTVVMGFIIKTIKPGQ